MADLKLETTLSKEQIEENFKDINFFEGLMGGLEEALSYEKGFAKAETYARKRSLPEINIAMQRESFKMTQKSYAALLGVSKRTVEAWESGRCTPSPTAKKLMYLLNEDPSLVQVLLMQALKQKEAQA